MIQKTKTKNFGRYRLLLHMMENLIGNKGKLLKFI